MNSNLEALHAFVFEAGFGCAEIDGNKGSEKICIEGILPIDGSRVVLVEESSSAMSPRILRLVRVATPAVARLLLNFQLK